MTGTDVADRLFAAIEAGDLDTVRALYARDAVIWHNTDGTEQTVDQNLRVLRWVVDHLADRRYDEVRRSPTPTGFVQQHVLRCTRDDGTRVEVPACLVVTCAEGRITRLEEYLDSAHIARLAIKE